MFEYSSDHSISDNTLERDGSDPDYGLHRTAGIALIGNTAPILMTIIVGNAITDVQVGVYEDRTEHTVLKANTTSSVQYPVVKRSR